MAADIDPVLESWYRHLDKGQEFCVVAVDDDGFVEIQYFDGSLEAIDLEAWYELDIETADEPENWSGALDVSETDDLGTEITDTTEADWRAPAEEVRHQADNDPLIEAEPFDSMEEPREGES